MDDRTFTQSCFALETFIRKNPQLQPFSIKELKILLVGHKIPRASALCQDQLYASDVVETVIAERFDEEELLLTADMHFYVLDVDEDEHYADLDASVAA